jgi:hypothetical protein
VIPAILRDENGESLKPLADALLAEQLALKQAQGQKMPKYGTPLLNDDDDWAKNYRSFHLGEKLIALAVRFAEFDAQPIRPSVRRLLSRLKPKKVGCFPISH